MAIYSLRMSAVGKTTQKQPFTAAAHLKYITRKQAVTSVLAARMPDQRRSAIAWLKREERQDRKNARVIDKLVLALPRELDAVHQQALVKAFAEELTQGRASWFAAFHTKGKDAANPHCHLILRDRDALTGRRVMFLSAGKKEATERGAKGQSAPTTLAKIRALWERCANAALEVAGRPERIDRRSLKEQGITRKPQVHEGPNIRAMHRRGFRPRSKDRVLRNSPYRRAGQAKVRVVRYAEIDKGMTRVEYNAALRQGARAADARKAGRAVQTPVAVVVPFLAEKAPEAASYARPALPSAHLDVRRRDAPQPAAHAQSRSESKHAPNMGQQVASGPSTLTASLPTAIATSQPPSRSLTLTEMLALEHGTPAAQPTRPAVRDRGR